MHTYIHRLLSAVALGLIVATSAAANDWNVLFDGTHLKAWRPARDNQQFALVDGVIVGSGSDQTHFLHTIQEYDDFELELEVKLPDTHLNSGIQIRTKLTRVSDEGEARANVHGPQVDLGKSPGRSGHIYGQGNKGWITPRDDLVSHTLMKNGEWNKVRVLAVGPRIQTWINGEPVTDLVNEEIYKQYPKGVIALQVHGVKKSTEMAGQVSFRAIRIRPIVAQTTGSSAGK